MTIDEAINNICSVRSRLGMDVDERLQDALQLGIEALKAIKSYRFGGDIPNYATLPGETEEVKVE